MPTSSYYKFNDYAEQVNKGVHDWSTHSFKVALCLTAPVAANATLSALTQIASGGGYTDGAGGGYTLDNETLSEASGTAKMAIDDEVITATGAAIAQFRYPAVYNDSATSPADATVFWMDYGSALDLAEGETLTINFDGSGGVWTMA